MSRFLSPTLEAVTPYTPGEQPQDQQYIKLNTNESPYLPSPAVVGAVSEAEVEKLRLYSDPAPPQANGKHPALRERTPFSEFCERFPQPSAAPP